MGLATSLKQTANNVIGKFGESVKVALVREGEYDTATRSITRSTVDYDVNAVVAEKRERAATGAEVRRLTVLFSATALDGEVITERDRLYVRGSEVQNVRVEPIVVEGETVAYNVTGTA